MRAGKVRSVVRVTQSPVNPQKWCLDLSCGHEKWVRGKRKPSKRVVPCNYPECLGR
jgi:hypothetical protein